MFPHSSADEPSGSKVPVLRILDAAANRAGEGLRVVEDYVRFALDDRHLTNIVKRLRHALAEALSELTSTDRHAARDTTADVGTEVTTPGESTRDDLWSVAAAGLKRAEQSLRTLEEYSKLVDARLAAKFEALRYETYTLERAIDLTRTSLERLAGARLYVLIDGGPSLSAFSSLVETLVTAGVHAIQLRDKELVDRELLKRAERLRQLTRDSQTLFIMNDRPDLALLAGADGVHVGQEELTVKQVRTIIGTGRLVGVSTHSIEQARAAVLDGANYIGVGPTFPSVTKSFAEFAGLDLVRAVGAEIQLPAFAIGGITLDNLADVRHAGLARVAVGAAITAADDPSAMVLAFSEQLCRIY